VTCDEDIVPEHLAMVLAEPPLWPKAPLFVVGIAKRRS
jgi:hypothetical protein